MSTVNSKYKLVAIDIDGTTVDKNGLISQVNIDMIRRVVKQGVPVCLVTGRNIHNANKIAKKLNVKTPMICCDGAVMYDPVDKKNVYEKIFSKEQLELVLGVVNKHKVFVEMSSDKHYYQYIKEKELGKFNYGGSPNNLAGKIQRVIQHNVRFVSDLNKFQAKDPKINQVIFAGEESNLLAAKTELIEKLKEANHTDVLLRDDLWKDYVFTSPLKVTKSDGVRFLCVHYGVKIEEVIAIGDELNDIDMIASVGLGIAVENANPRIKEIAKFITLSNDDDGVAYALEKFIINGEDICNGQ